MKLACAILMGMGLVSDGDILSRGATVRDVLAIAVFMLISMALDDTGSRR